MLFDVVEAGSSRERVIFLPKKMENMPTKRTSRASLLLSDISGGVAVQQWVCGEGGEREGKSERRELELGGIECESVDKLITSRRQQSHRSGGPSCYHVDLPRMILMRRVDEGQRKRTF